MPGVESASFDRAKYHHGDLRRALVDAALTMVSEKQNWDFSLREVARRAGVSHSAPYNHFPDKRDLLAAVAAAGFDKLRDRLLEATRDDDPKASLIATGVAYVRYAADNPAHYRLMFGPSLISTNGHTSTVAVDASARAKAVLADAIKAGVGSGAFVPKLAGDAAFGIAVLSAWAIVHGLAMLVIDGLIDDRASASTTSLSDAVTRTLMEGLVTREP